MTNQGELFAILLSALLPEIRDAASRWPIPRVTDTHGDCAAATSVACCRESAARLRVASYLNEGPA
ncbi:MAG: hypothetical protein QM784_38845 [Polyangiaceae bacterium]